MKVTEGKKIYFASDNHLGIPDSRSSLAREMTINLLYIFGLISNESNRRKENIFCI